MRNPKDQDLHRRFQDLRAQEGPRAPDFDSVMARAREEAAQEGLELLPTSRVIRRIPRRMAWGGVLLAAASAAVLLLVQIPDTSDSDFVRVVEGYTVNPAAGSWRSPTDGLLQLPGDDILTTIPGIKTSRWMVAPEPNSRRNDT